THSVSSGPDRYRPRVSADPPPRRTSTIRGQSQAAGYRSTARLADFPGFRYARRSNRRFAWRSFGPDPSAERQHAPEDPVAFLVTASDFFARSAIRKNSLDSQLEQLRGAGCSSRNIYREKVTGARADRRELNRMLGKLAPGDVVTVTRID